MGDPVLGAGRFFVEVSCGSSNDEKRTCTCVVTYYNRLSSKMLTYTMLILIGVSIPIYYVSASLQMIPSDLYQKHMLYVVPHAFILYGLYRLTHEKEIGKYLISAYLFIIEFTSLWFIPSSNAGFLVLVYVTLSLIYLNLRVTLLASLYGLIVLCIHHSLNPYLHLNSVNVIVLYTIFGMCCLACISICIIGKRFYADLHRSERAALDNESRYRHIFDLAPEANLVHRGDQVLFVNQAGLAMFGAARMEDVIELNVSSFVLPQYQPLLAHRLTLLKEGKKLERMELQIYNYQGEIMDVEVNSILLHFNGQPAVLTSIRDITQVKMSRDWMDYMKYHDLLTDLPNRNCLLKRLEKEIQSAEAGMSGLAVMLIDLDRFKMINDTFGHTAGDFLLKSFAQRLRTLLPKYGFVARLDGDQFVALLPDATNRDAEQLIAKLMDELIYPFHTDGLEVIITASVGLAMYPKDGRSAELLIKHADMAMCSAKEQGISHYVRYDDQMSEENSRKLRMEHDLRRALDQRELHLVYQRKENIQTGQLIGLESLLRWNHPKLGMISPAEFIPLAEENGLIIPIGEWVVRSVCEQINAWQQLGLAVPPVAINLSVRQFKQDDLAERLAQILEENGIAPGHIELEITESVASSNNEEELIRKLYEIKRLGVLISLDDFGTGYSSFSCLRKFPIDTLKIDKSFMKDIAQKQEDMAIVSAIIGMAHSLQLQVLAEGVESGAQLELLKQHKCDAVQGYFHGYPAPPEEIAGLLALAQETKDNSRVS
ncbi:EAL domain-containing protein [Paenibacillus whitsoniae]|uniref:EAL domain-containing protein n=1 Tax=Paenibacillus whitsoniae TaxID=2496558 RepID=A0A430JAW2_9BACL|nr:EAL domain-containing protein [Paenibacillus whitsoniae]